MPSSQAKLHLEGVPELLRAYSHLRDGVKGQALRQALNKASTPLFRAIKYGLPRRTGALRKSIKRKLRVVRGGQIAYLVIGADRSVVGKTKSGRTVQPARYFHFVNNGTRPHTIAPKSATKLRINDDAWPKLVRHPGARGTRTVQRAIDAHGKAAVANIRTMLAQLLAKAARKAKRR